MNNENPEPLNNSDGMMPGTSNPSGLGWDDIAQLPEEKWWSGDATKRIEAIIGLGDTQQPLRLFFGVDDDNRPCAHGSLVAMTGAGKTALFHSLIMSLTTQYSPDELQLILMDGKMGVGFNSYRHLPHAEVISLNTRPSLAHSLLTELIEEMSVRNELFKKNQVEHFIGYREKGSPDGHLPRLLLIADEYQILFEEDDDDQEAAKSLLRLSEQARSAGIHLLLGSQHFIPANIIHRDLIFSNFHLRIVMKMTQFEINSAELGQNARELVTTTCTETGRVVINDYAGNDDKNIAGMVAFLPEVRRQTIITSLYKRRRESKNQVIFDGDHQPNILASPICKNLLQTSLWDSPEQAELLSRRSIRQGGLGIVDWVASERPIGLLLGTQYSVRGQAFALLRRRQYENLCIIGEEHSERAALLVATITSTCLQLSPREVTFLISNHSAQQTEWSNAIHQIAVEARSLGYQVQYDHEEKGAQTAIATAFNEMKKRQQMAESKQIKLPSIIVMLVEPDRVAALHRIANDYDFDDSMLGQSLRQLLDEGPMVGIHIIVSFVSLGAAKNIMQERHLQVVFRHKVAMQMSEDDSYDLLGSPKATKVQAEGSRPISALLVDSQNDKTVLFSPYTIRTQTSESLLDQVEVIFAQLQSRR